MTPPVVVVGEDLLLRLVQQPLHLLVRTFLCIENAKALAIPAGRMRRVKLDAGQNAVRSEVELAVLVSGRQQLEVGFGHQLGVVAAPGCLDENLRAHRIDNAQVQQALAPLLLKPLSAEAIYERGDESGTGGSSCSP